MDKLPVRCFDGNAKPHEPFWSWRNVAEGEEPEMELYGYVSEYSWWEDDITPKMFKDDLLKIGKKGPITLRIHSGGGDLTAASVMSAIMTDYPGRITVKIDGLCASAAVQVALAGDRVLMQESAYMMIHDPWTYAVGNADELKSVVEALNVSKDGILDCYETKTGMDRNKLSKMMSDITWMNARKAEELGFVDEVITANSQQKAVNSIGNSKIFLNALTPQMAKLYGNIPDELQQPAVQPVIDPDEPQNQGVDEPKTVQDPVVDREKQHAVNVLRARAQSYL